MKIIKDWQNNLQPHSKAKIELLKEYLAKYLQVLSNSPFFSDIFLFDVYCGHGVYDDGGFGSPIVMLEEIERVLQSGFCSKVNYHCFFNDNNPDYINQLKTFIEEIGHSKKITISYSCCEYNNALESVSSQINKLSPSAKAFVFIDPWGYRDVRFADIQSLLATKKAEVLLFLPTQFMFRVESNGTPKCLQCLIEELVPLDEWPISSTGIDFIENLKSHFKLRLGNDYYVDTFIIERDAGQHYCLFFFTSHIYGFQKMLEAKWVIDNNEGRVWRFMRTEYLFDGHKSSITFRFEDELRAYLLSNSRTNKDVYEFTLHKGHLPIHTNEVLKAWQIEDTLSVLKSNGEPAKKGSFYLNHKEWRNSPKKVTFYLKTK